MSARERWRMPCIIFSVRPLRCSFSYDGHTRASMSGTSIKYRFSRFFFFITNLKTKPLRGIEGLNLFLMKKYLIICIACISLLCTSCGISRSATGNTNLAQTEVVLAKKNYKVIGTVRGESTQNYWFGIGGLSKKSLAQSAMNDMYESAELMGKSRAVINVNVAYKNTFALIFCKSKAIATGTVIEFTE